MLRVFCSTYPCGTLSLCSLFYYFRNRFLCFFNVSILIVAYLFSFAVWSNQPCVNAFVNLCGFGCSCVLQEPGRTDRPLCGWLPSTRSTQGRHGGGRSSAAQLCWPVCLLQEVHGAVLPTEHRRTDDRSHNHLPEILERVRLEDPLRQPA